MFPDLKKRPQEVLMAKKIETLLYFLISITNNRSLFNYNLKILLPQFLLLHYPTPSTRLLLSNAPQSNIWPHTVIRSRTGTKTPIRYCPTASYLRQRPTKQNYKAPAAVVCGARFHDTRPSGVSLRDKRNSTRRVIG